MTLELKPNLCNVKQRCSQLTESNAFSAQRLRTIDLSLFLLIYSIKCSARLALSCVCLFFRNPVWSSSTVSGIIFSNRFATIEAYSLQSQFKNRNRSVRAALRFIFALLRDYGNDGKLKDAGVSPPLSVKLKHFSDVGDNNSLNVLYDSAEQPSSPGILFVFSREMALSSSLCYFIHHYFILFSSYRRQIQ